MLPTFDQCITFGLWWLLAGSLTWWALWCRDVVHEINAERGAKAISVVIASAGVIVLWPVAWLGVAYGVVIMLRKGVRR
ncbi:hypothetical protein IC762_17585 [Bradyrhizobium genosp. L]|uniref:hypothetical protein n=1 Tax=Bradyrhizobium genosp. L TaxID=83637 RepID=UPI0018A27276|nr:hypothetical protein [Bradyrhizobium genosp. L]QPF81638.1 hypothetical protein IC762_17585 [Bradyrhizobium genosp. L]